MKKEVYLLTGSNLHNPQEQLSTARELINRAIGEVLRESSVFETAPWGDSDQPVFLNQVLIIATELAPAEVMGKLLAIEERMGRVRNTKWGPRLIDIDILFYDEEVIDRESLSIPHPRIAERRFTLAPLAEVAPDFMHPVLQKSISQLLQECPDPLTAKKLHAANE